MREFQDYLDFEGLSYYQQLSEDFIREFQDRVSWKWIAYNTLSGEFRAEFKDRL
jgi:hypothetical protein